MEAILTLLLICAALVINAAIVVFLYRPRKGRFKLLGQDTQLFHFLTNFGEFTIDRGSQTLVMKSRKGIMTIPFDRILRLDYRMLTNDALVQELWYGLDLWDFTGAYRDVTNWFQISAVLVDGQKLPLYTVGQWEPREPFSERWFELQRGLLRMVGLCKEVDAVSLSVVKQIQRAFTDRGRQLSLV